MLFLYGMSFCILCQNVIWFRVHYDIIFYDMLYGLHDDQYIKFTTYYFELLYSILLDLLKERIPVGTELVPSWEKQTLLKLL